MVFEREEREERVEDFDEDRVERPDVLADSVGAEAFLTRLTSTVLEPTLRVLRSSVA
ncbi:MAG: hypothetical protein MUP76_02760 [Acidimicrobiia bacterium]|nr:hypothetical protein [Acidimicrobiia bacterium]